MLGPQRRGQIVEKVEREGVIRIAEIVKTYGVSRKTALRDLDLLDAEGLLDKVHGGAVAIVESHGRPALTAHPGDAERTLHVGVVLPSRGHYNRAVLHGVEDRLPGARLSVVTTGWHRSDTLAKHLDALVRAEVDGVLVRPAPVPGGDSGTGPRPWLEAMTVPSVLIEDEAAHGERTDAWSVVTDDRRGIAAAIDHLRELGHRRISLVTVSDAPRSRELQLFWHQSLAETGLDTDVPVIDGSTFDSWPLPDPAALDTILTTLRSSAATAVICHNDVPARALADHATAAGWSIPGDLSMIAYEDRISTRVSHPISAVALPGREVGREAAQSLLDILEDSSRPPRQIRIAPELVLRQSTGQPSVDSGPA